MQGVRYIGVGRSLVLRFLVLLLFLAAEPSLASVCLSALSPNSIESTQRGPYSWSSAAKVYLSGNWNMILLCGAEGAEVACGSVDPRSRGGWWTDTASHSLYLAARVVIFLEIR